MCLENALFTPILRRLIVNKALKSSQARKIPSQRFSAIDFLVINVSKPIGYWIIEWKMQWASLSRLEGEDFDIIFTHLSVSVSIVCFILKIYSVAPSSQLDLESLHLLGPVYMRKKTSPAKPRAESRGGVKSLFREIRKNRPIRIFQFSIF